MSKACYYFGISCMNSVSVKRNISLFLFLFLLGNFVYGQKYEYQFEIQNVTNRAYAKDITGLIRPIFNEEDEPFLYFPTYNETLGLFDFESDMDISKVHLEDKLGSNSLVLISFKRIDRVGDLAKTDQP